MAAARLVAAAVEGRKMFSWVSGDRIGGARVGEGGQPYLEARFLTILTGEKICGGDGDDWMRR